MMSQLAWLTLFVTWQNTLIIVILTAVTVTIICYTLSLLQLLSCVTLRDSPFSLKYVRPPSPIVTDRANRNSVLKQKFTADKVPENLDAIVIGSGIGGLSVAVLLSRVGKRVLVLEQHDQAGGCCHAFTDKGYEFDTGIHYLGEFHETSINRVLMDQLSCGQIVWDRMDEVYDKVLFGDIANPRVYGIAHPGQKSFESIKQQFPGEWKAIEKLQNIIKDAGRSFVCFVILKILPKRLSKFLVWSGIMKLVFPAFFKFSQLSLQEVLDSLTDNQELKAVLSYCFGDYGTMPTEAPFIMHAALINALGMSGAWYPRGGSSEIAFHLIPNIEKSGGRVLVKAPVSEILLDQNGRAYGVRVERKSTNIDVFAPLIISDAGVTNTFRNLLPSKSAAKSSLLTLSETLGPSISTISVFVGIRGTSDELGLKSSNTWVFTSPDFKQIFDTMYSTPAAEAENADIPMLFISFPSAKDSSWESRYPGKSTAILITFVPYHWFQEWENTKSKIRGQDYEKFKNAIAQRLWKKCIQRFPKLENKVEYFDIGTPLSNNFYLNVQKGEVYGLDHNTRRFQPDAFLQLTPETDIPGLYLTGQDMCVCGLGGALIGGVICASKILKRQLLVDVLRIQYQLNKVK